MALPRVIGRLLLDILSFLAVTLPTVLLLVCGKPFHRGFFCDDQSIKYPYRSDTVTGMALFAGGFLFPICLFAAVEAIYFSLMRKSTKFSTTYEITRTCSISKFFVNFYKVFGVFIFGVAVHQTMTFIGKYTAGRLRPNFLAICQPDLAAFNCTSSVYVEEDICTRKPDMILWDSRMSFPSGHSSFSAYVAVFLVLYLQTRMTWKFSQLLRPCLQSILIFVAFFVCLSRVSDNRHHWNDVLAGAFLGAFIGSLAGLHISSELKDSKSNEVPQLTYQAMNSIEEGSSSVTQS